MKLKHMIVKLNGEDQIEKILWTEEYESFEFARLYYELQRQTFEIEDAEEYVGVFEYNEHQWFYGLDKWISLPSGELLNFKNYEPSEIESAYFLDHSAPYLILQEMKKAR